MFSLMFSFRQRILSDLYEKKTYCVETQRKPLYIIYIAKIIVGRVYFVFHWNIVRSKLCTFSCIVRRVENDTVFSEYYSYDVNIPKRFRSHYFVKISLSAFSMRCSKDSNKQFKKQTKTPFSITRIHFRIGSLGSARPRRFIIVYSTADRDRLRTEKKKKRIEIRS